MKHDEDIDPWALRCLVAVVLEGGVTRAAERLGVGQPALSHVLARLRRRFNDPLLVRGQSGMAPTPRALYLAQVAQDVLATMEQLGRNPDDFDPSRERGRFVVTVADYFERLLAPALLARLAQEAPGASVEWRLPNPALVRGWLERGEVDLRIAWVQAPWPGLRFTRLFTDHLVGLVRKGHPILGARPSLEQFLSARHVRPAVALADTEPGLRLGTHLSVEQYLGMWASAIPGKTRRSPTGRSPRDIDHDQALRASTVEVSMLTQSFLSIPELVLNTDLVATVPQLMFKNHPPHRSLRLFEPPLNLPPMPGALYWHERTQDDARHRWFRRLVTDVAKAVTV